MDTQTLITKSGNWSDDNLTIPFEKVWTNRFVICCWTPWRKR